MTNFLFSILGNIAGLWLANKYIEGFVVNGKIQDYVIVAVFLGLLNLILKPILKLITSPLILITLGLFVIVINGLLLWITDSAFSFITIESISALVGSTLIVSAMNLVVGFLNKVYKKSKNAL